MTNYNSGRIIQNINHPSNLHTRDNSKVNYFYCYIVHVVELLNYYTNHCTYMGTAVAQWLRCCATNRKVAGSIPGCVSGLFIDIKFLRTHYGPGVDSASKRNEYQEHFRGIKAAGA